jgi:hypothetical protein
MTPSDGIAKLPPAPPARGEEAPRSLSGAAAAGPELRAGTPPGAPADRPAVIADAVKIVAWLSLSAGAIHAIAMIEHFSHWWLYGVFFLVLTYGQILWGVQLLRKPTSDRSLKIGALANLAICMVWLVSRTIGIPIGPESGSPESVGVADVAATLDQLVLAAYVALILRPDLRTVRGLRTLLGVHRIRLAMMLCSVGVFAAMIGGHSH